MAENHPRFVFAWYRLGAAALRRLPQPLATALARLGAWCWWRSSRVRRRVVGENLVPVLGAGTTTRALDALVHEAFTSYARYWTESIRLDARDLASLEKVFSLTNGHYVEEAIAAQDGVILVLPHLGSWEIGGLWGIKVGHPLTVAVEPLEPAALFDWFVARREAIGLRVVALGEGSSAALLSTLRGGGVVALVADRDITGDGVEVEFFGERVRLPAGPAVLALRSGAALLPCALYQRPGAKIEAVVCPPIDTARAGRLRDDVARVTQAVAHAFEPLIAAAPAQWHVFVPYWSPTGERAS